MKGLREMHTELETGAKLAATSISRKRGFSASSLRTSMPLTTPRNLCLAALSVIHHSRLLAAAEKHRAVVRDGSERTSEDAGGGGARHNHWTAQQLEKRVQRQYRHRNKNEEEGTTRAEAGLSSVGALFCRKSGVGVGRDSSDVVYVRSSKRRGKSARPYRKAREIRRDSTEETGGYRRQVLFFV